MRLGGKQSRTGIENKQILLAGLSGVTHVGKGIVLDTTSDWSVGILRSCLSRCNIPALDWPCTASGEGRILILSHHTLILRVLYKTLAPLLSGRPSSLQGDCANPSSTSRHLPRTSWAAEAPRGLTTWLGLALRTGKISLTL